jgi:hypothetical protein
VVVNRRRLVGIARDGVLLPSVTIGAVVGVVSFAGYDVGLTVLVVSMVGAAGAAGVLLTDTRRMRPDDDEGALDRDTRSSVALRSRLTETPDAGGGRGERAISRFTGGLFVLSVLLVFYLGGVF